MAVTCTSAAWATGGACYNENIVGPKAQLALLVYALALAADSAASTSYATTLSTTLIEDATSNLCGLPDEQLQAGLIDTIFDYTSDATTLDEKMEAIKCLLPVNDGTLHLLIYYLICVFLDGLSSQPV